MTLQTDDYQNFVMHPDAGVHFTISALAQLLKSSHAARLLRYFGAVDVFIEPAPKTHRFSDPSPSKIVNGSNDKRNISGTYDTCLLGFATRSNEIAWQAELLHELLQARIRVLCLAQSGTPQWQAFEECLADFRASQQQTGSLLIDTEKQYAPDQRAIDREAMQDWRLFHEVLEPLDLQVNPNAFGLFHRVAEMSALWANLFSEVSIKSLVVRNNHAPENSSAAIIAKSFGIQVFSFQHSVLSSMPSVCPTFADIFYCHGRTSQAILEQFSVATCGFEPEYRAIGMWNQPQVKLVQDFTAGRILLVDQECAWSKAYFGNAAAYQQLRDVIGEILQCQPNINWRVRLHFDNDRLDIWEQLAREFPGRLELSRAESKPFAEELKDISLVAGLFSTAICEAAKLGYPVVFLHEAAWFRTPDLADFGGVTMGIHEFGDACAGILSNRDVYTRIRKTSMISANQYYLSQRKGLFSVAQDIKQAS